jgi:hypothetical protein
MNIQGCCADLCNCTFVPRLLVTITSEFQWSSGYDARSITPRRMRAFQKPSSAKGMSVETWVRFPPGTISFFFFAFGFMDVGELDELEEPDSILI